MSIGCAIKYFREKVYPLQGGQAEFAEKIGVTRQEVSAWENGKRKPTLKSIRKIAKALNVTIEEITNYGNERDRADKSNDEYWKDLAMAYKARIIELEAQLNDTQAELIRLKNG